MREPKTKLVCFWTSETQSDELNKLAITRDNSLSQLLRAIVAEYLTKQGQPDQPAQQ